jgi:hypothetical protein
MELEKAIPKENILRSLANRIEKKTLDESILDPIHKTLNKNIFGDDKKMLPKVRQYLMDTFNEWLTNNTEYDPKDIKSMELVGSNCGFQYGETSDVDVNIILPQMTKDEIDEIWGQLPNGNELPGTDHPINYYLLPDKKDETHYDAIYDILKNDWVKKQKKEAIKIPYSYVMHIARFFMEAIDLRLAEYQRDKRELESYEEQIKEADIESDKKDIQDAIELKKTEILADLDSLLVALNMVHAFRGEAFDSSYEPYFLINIVTKSPNYSVNNVVYKILEKHGYVDQLKALRGERDKIKKRMK